MLEERLLNDMSTKLFASLPVEGAHANQLALLTRRSYFRIHSQIKAKTESFVGNAPSSNYVTFLGGRRSTGAKLPTYQVNLVPNWESRSNWVQI